MKGVDLLDNPFWHSLTTRHRQFAVIGERAAFYLPQVSMFAGVAENTEEAYTELAEMIEPGRPILIGSVRVLDDHPDWMVVQITEAQQMIRNAPIEPTHARTDIRFEHLTPEDVPQMMKLIELTEPGPFFSRTIEMGGYIGIKVGGRLVAMGGERAKPEGYTEISAICTHPEHRGKGYAKAITVALTNEILERGETPFLHVKSTNIPAMKLYVKLGFNKRKTGISTVLMRKPRR